MAEDNLVYLLDEKVYINLTNKCTNNCIFCIRSLKDDVCGKNLWINEENVTTEAVVEQLNPFLVQGKKEIIFCGYGEPTIKFDILKAVSKWTKENYPEVKIRVNTNGHGNFIHKKDITQELKGLVDAFSVSLNASTEELYKELAQPLLTCESSLEVVKEFIKKSVESGIQTVATVVNGYKNYKIDLEECEKIARDLGAEFRVREWLDSGY